MRRSRVVIGALVAVLIAVATGAYVYLDEDEPIEKRGSATEEFVTTEPEEPKAPPKKENPRPWPTYSYDDQRRHISPYDHRPPYRRRSAMERSSWRSRRASSSRSTTRPAGSTGARASAAARRRRRRSARASSTSPTCTRSCANRARRAPTGSLWPGTRRPAARSGASTRRRSSRPRY